MRLKFRHSRSGATAMEYTFLVGAIATTMLASIVLIGDTTEDRFWSMTTSIVGSDACTEAMIAGQACADGTVLVGVDAITGQRVFTTRFDEMPRDFDAAASFCSSLQRHGHADWLLPDMGRLQMLYAERSQVANFSPVLYWSSEETSLVSAQVIDFDGGLVGSALKQEPQSFRCVRAAG